jgi:hypothetical protein
LAKLLDEAHLRSLGPSPLNHGSDQVPEREEDWTPANYRYHCRRWICAELEFHDACYQLPQEIDFVLCTRWYSPLEERTGFGKRGQGPAAVNLAPTEEGAAEPRQKKARSKKQKQPGTGTTDRPKPKPKKGGSAKQKEPAIGGESGLLKEKQTKARKKKGITAQDSVAGEADVHCGSDQEDIPIALLKIRK